MREQDWMGDPLFVAAAPDCAVTGCASPVAGVRVSWKRDGRGEWVVKRAYLVCLNEHLCDVTPDW